MHSRLQDRQRVRVGIVGVGNCASSLVQGLTYYRNAKSNEPVPGLMNASSHVELKAQHLAEGLAKRAIKGAMGTATRASSA